MSWPITAIAPRLTAAVGARVFARAILIPLIAAGCSAVSTAPPVPPSASAQTPSISTPVATPSVDDCDGIALLSCQAAVAIVAEFGLFPEPSQTIVGWHVRPTRFKACDGVAQPKYDVTVDLETPAASQVVTVGVLPSGRLTVCTY